MLAWGRLKTRQRCADRGARTVQRLRSDVSRRRLVRGITSQLRGGFNSRCTSASAMKQRTWLVKSKSNCILQNLRRLAAERQGGCATIAICPCGRLIRKSSAHAFEYQPEQPGAFGALQSIWWLDVTEGAMSRRTSSLPVIIATGPGTGQRGQKIPHPTRNMSDHG